MRHKIEKAGAAKQRKERKLAKKNPEWRSRLKKDPGIPNLFPYKDKILQELEEKRRLKELESAKRKEESKSKQNVNKELRDLNTLKEQKPASADELSDLLDEEDDEEDGMEDETRTDSNPMGALLVSAKARANEYENVVSRNGYEDGDAMDEDSSLEDTSVERTSVSLPSQPWDVEGSRRAYDKIFGSVLASSDVLLYVLDARDPNGTRSQDVERGITAAEGGSKRLILVLNKIDLVPPSTLKAWLVYLRRYFPTLPLRASTSAPNAKTFDHKALTVKRTSETLLRSLKSYAHSKQMKRSISVGVVGYPNVGKSSVINVLVSRLSSRNPSDRTACVVGAEAGVTKALKEIKLDGKIKLLDSPGIVFPSSMGLATLSTEERDQIPHLSPKQFQQAHLTLLSALPPSSVTDPIPAITLLLHRLSKSEAKLAPLLDQYDLSPSTLVPTGPNGDVTTDFLIQVARKRGRLGKGGVPNLPSAAMGVLMDWRDGRIRGWVDAPESMETGDQEQSADQKEIVTQWAEEFKLEGLWGDDSRGVDEDMQL